MTRTRLALSASIVALVLILAATVPVVLAWTGPMLRDAIGMSNAPVWARWEAMRLVDNACVVQDWYWEHYRR